MMAQCHVGKTIRIKFTMAQKDMSQSIVDALAQGPLTAQELVAAMKIPAAQAQALVEPMKALEEGGFVTRDGATFALNLAAFGVEEPEAQDETANAFAQAAPVAQPAAKKAATKAPAAATKAALPKAQAPAKEVGVRATVDDAKGFVISGFPSLDRVSKAELQADVEAAKASAQAHWESGDAEHQRIAVILQRFVNRANHRLAKS